MRARHRAFRCVAGFVFAGAALAAPGTASAQEATDAFQLDQYRPAVSVDDGFVVSRPDDRGHLRMGARLDLDYALAPLVVESMAGTASSESGALVEHALRAHVGLSLGLFDRVVVFAGLPVDLVQSGTSVEGLPAGTGAGLGDVWLGARARLWGEPGELFALGVQLALTLPTAGAANAAQRYSGELGATVAPTVLLEVRPVSRLRLTGNVGARFRTDRAAEVVNLAIGHELTWALGATVDALPDLLAVYVEGFGGVAFDALGTPAARVGAPVEVLGGARVQAIPGLELGAALGTGLTRGVGAPDFRAVFTVGYAERPIRDSDRDADGLRDPVDGCPDQPEDADGWQDDDGCPDPDDDGDGILDPADACPRQPEDRDGDADDDGCPDPDAVDTDRDGILDPSDACVNEPEDADGWQDEDGCPDPDDDADGILDPQDRCPRQPETVNGFQEEDGCPDEAPAEAELRGLTARIYFPHDSAQPTGASREGISELARLMAAHPEWLVVTVEGHASDMGDHEYNLDLSRRRSARVRQMLVELGVAASRLETAALGLTQLERAGDTEEDHAANRRVSFSVTRRADR